MLQRILSIALIVCALHIGSGCGMTKEEESIRFVKRTLPRSLIDLEALIVIVEIRSQRREVYTHDSKLVNTVMETTLNLIREAAYCSDSYPQSVAVAYHTKDNKIKLTIFVIRQGRVEQVKEQVLVDPAAIAKSMAATQ